MKITNIMDDPRPIQFVVSVSPIPDEARYWSTQKTSEDYYRCDAIVPYHENGNGAPLVWFAIVRNGETIARVNSLHVVDIDYPLDTAETEAVG
jgi:hypothetical protein